MKKYSTKFKLKVVEYYIKKKIKKITKKGIKETKRTS